MHLITPSKIAMNLEAGHILWMLVCEIVPGVYTFVVLWGMN